MAPSRKIFIGSSAVITGVLCQILVSWLLTRSFDAMSTMQSGDSRAGEAIDQRLERLHSQTQIGFNAMTLSYVFILSGVVLLLIGVYQTARTVEALRASSTSQP